MMLKKKDHFFKNLLNNYDSYEESVQYLEENVLKKLIHTSISLFEKIEDEITQPFTFLQTLIDYSNELNIETGFLKNEIIPFAEKIGYFQYYSKARLVILKFERLIEAIKTIENCVTETSVYHQGVSKTSLSKKIDNNGEFRDYTDDILDILEMKNLTFNISDKYFFPDLIELDSQICFEHFRPYIELIHSIEFEEYQNSIVNRLNAEYGPTDNRKEILYYWNNELLIYKDPVKIWLKDFPNENRVDLYISFDKGEKQTSESREALSNLYLEFDKIKINEIKAKKIICCCERCIETWLKSWNFLTVTSYTYNVLKNLFGNNFQTIYCNYTQEMFEVESLLGYKSFKNIYLKKTNYMKKVFIAYSRTLSEYADRLNYLLQLFVKNNKITTFYDKNMYLGVKWNQKIIDELKQSDIFIFLLNNDAFLSDYINDVEFKIAIDKHKNGGQVIPIFIENSQRDETPFGEILGFPREGFYDELIKKVGKNNAENFLLNEIKQYF